MRRMVEWQGQQEGRGSRRKGIHTLDVPELFERVGGIRDELSKEDLEHTGEEEGGDVIKGEKWHPLRGERRKNTTPKRTSLSV
jgi:hypothetical protein